MIELLSTLTFSQILIYAVLFAVAAKEFYSMKDFFKKRTDDKYEEENKERKQIEQILLSIQNLEMAIEGLNTENIKFHEKIEDVTEYLQGMEKDFRDTLRLLLESDRDAIKSFLVKEHHHFIAKKWIDDFSLDTVEKRYGHYKAEGGNSYIGELMLDLRKLPNVPPSESYNE